MLLLGEHFLLSFLLGHTHLAVTLVNCQRDINFITQSIQVMVAHMIGLLMMNSNLEVGLAFIVYCQPRCELMDVYQFRSPKYFQSRVM